MRPLIIKFGPSGAVAAMIAFCLWPWFFSESTVGEGTEPPKMPEIAPTMLSPAMAAQPKRDPFRAHDAIPLAKQVGIPAAKGSAAPGQRDMAGSIGAGKSKETPQAAESVNAIPGLTLKGTSAHGRERLALINGKLYAEGDMLSLGEPAGAQYRVNRILPYKVMLKYNHQELELSYSNVAVPNGAAGAGKDKRPDNDAGKDARSKSANKTEEPSRAR